MGTRKATIRHGHTCVERGWGRGEWRKLSAVGWTLDPEGIPRWIVVCQENVQITRDGCPDQVMDAEEVVGRLSDVPV